MAYCNSVFLLSVPPCFCYCQSLLYSVEYEYSLTEYKFRVNADKNIHQAYILREQILTNTFSPALHIFHISKYFKVFQSIRKQICSASHLFSIPNVFFRSPDKTAPHIPNQMIFYRYCLPFFVHIAQLNFRNFFLKNVFCSALRILHTQLNPEKDLFAPSLPMSMSKGRRKSFLMNDVSEVRDWIDLKLISTFFQSRVRRKKTQRTKTTMKIHDVVLLEGENHCKTFENL